MTRGPSVYCFEGADNSVGLNRVRLPKEAQFAGAFEPDILDGMVTLTADWSSSLYRREPPNTAPTPIKAVPYFAWDNRAPGQMLVWLR